MQPKLNQLPATDLMIGDFIRDDGQPYEILTIATHITMTYQVTQARLRNLNTGRITLVELPKTVDVYESELDALIAVMHPIAAMRELLGQVVREAWVKWAQTQPDAKPHWLEPWEKLEERHKEVDRQIGTAVSEFILAQLTLNAEWWEHSLRLYSTHQSAWSVLFQSMTEQRATLDEQLKAQTISEEEYHQAIEMLKHQLETMVPHLSHIAA